jgi:hypothetical protein
MRSQWFHPRPHSTPLLLPRRSTGSWSIRASFSHLVAIRSSPNSSDRWQTFVPAHMTLLMQVVLSHDAVRPGELCRSMPADTIYTDPAAGVKEAVKQQGLGVCSIVQCCTNMRELLAGKTKLKLHAPGSAPLPSSSGGWEDALGVRRSSTFGHDVTTGLPQPLPLSLGEEPQPATMGHGTLAFNISQIFSSRASLEALARAKLADTEKTPENDGFDEVGIVRSTAFLASLLPLGRRVHHRPGSHLRGPSNLDHHHGHGHHGHTNSFGGPALQRSKTSGAPSGSLSSVLHGMGSGPAMATLLEKMVCGRAVSANVRAACSFQYLMSRSCVLV